MVYPSGFVNFNIFFKMLLDLIRISNLQTKHI